MIDQTEPVGHAVRAMYMYSGMADVAALEDDAKIKAAATRSGTTSSHSKLYITGGIGAAGGHEGFGEPYDLPNMTAYNETCASVGMDYWNHRLFLLHGDAKYIDIMERTLYNGLISGVSLKGDTFFYPNPLESNGQHARSSGSASPAARATSRASWRRCPATSTRSARRGTARRRPMRST